MNTQLINLLFFIGGACYQFFASFMVHLFRVRRSIKVKPLTPAEIYFLIRVRLNRIDIENKKIFDSVNEANEFIKQLKKKI